MNRKNKRKKAFVAMSGGVDSSLAAFLLKRDGFDVTGVFMRCWSQFSSDALGTGAPCGAERDAEDARRVSGHLGIPFYVWDFEDEYKKHVVDYMVQGYREGITPNPDVMCNREIKFGLFFEKARRMGADFIATGHYVSLRSLPRTAVEFDPAANSPLSLPSRTHLVRDQATVGFESFSEKSPAQFGLFEAKDKNKDQSYFLWTLRPQQLRYCLFPIGDYLKSEVRQIAREAELPTADKKDSQGICFIGKITLPDFLKQYIPERTGAVITTDGKKVGEHVGAQFYTIGQRHGLVSGSWSLGTGKRDQKPVYVATKDVVTNTIVVAEGENHPSLYRKEIRLTNVNFINQHHSPIRANWRMGVFARVRYRQPLAKADLERSISNFRLIFDEPVKFVAPGQSAVFYTNEGEMLGGGVIEKTL